MERQESDLHTSPVHGRSQRFPQSNWLRSRALMHAADGMLAMLLSPSKGYPRIFAGCDISMNGV